MLPNRSEFPIIHDAPDDETFGFQFIWNHVDEDLYSYAMCYLPVLNTQIIVRPLEHVSDHYMVNVNSNFSIYHDMSFHEVLSEVERKVCGQVLRFLLNVTNLNQLIEHQGKEVLDVQIRKCAP